MAQFANTNYADTAFRTGVHIRSNCHISLDSCIAFTYATHWNEQVLIDAITVHRKRHQINDIVKHVVCSVVDALVTRKNHFISLSSTHRYSLFIGKFYCRMLTIPSLSVFIFARYRNYVNMHCTSSTDTTSENTKHCWHFTCTNFSIVWLDKARWQNISLCFCTHGKSEHSLNFR